MFPLLTDLCFSEAIGVTEKEKELFAKCSKIVVNFQKFTHLKST